MEMNFEAFAKEISNNLDISSEDLIATVFANICFGISRNKSSKNEIEKLYAKSCLEYYKESSTSNINKNPIFSQGTLGQEIAARKALGVFLAAEKNNQLRDKLIRILRKHYAVIYEAVVKKDKKGLIKRYTGMDEVTLKLEARIDSSIYMYFCIYRSQEHLDQGFLRAILLDIKSYQSQNPITVENSNSFDTNSDQVSSAKQFIKHNDLKVTNYKDILSSSVQKLNKFGKYLDFIFKYNKLDVKLLFSDYEYNNIDKLLVAYTKAYGSEIDADTIIPALASGVFIQNIIDEYKSSRRAYFNDTSEELDFKIEELINKLANTEHENSINVAEIEKLKEAQLGFEDKLDSQIDKLNKQHLAQMYEKEMKIKELEEKLVEEEVYKRELNSLREFIFESNKNYIPENIERNFGKYVENKKILIIGGPKEWRRKLRENYDGIRCLNGFNEKFELTILDNYDYIFFYTGLMNHATYYKAINFIRANNVKFGYVGKTNIDLVEKEIIDEIERINAKE